eukprot:SAG22_NODE_23004_length_176_cov_73.168831_1_plen_46_part_01
MLFERLLCLDACTLFLLLLQLMEIIDAEKQAADEERRLSSMDEEEK